MLKKIITTGLLSVSALAIMTANALPLDDTTNTAKPKNYKKNNVSASKKRIAPAKVSDSDDQNENDDNKNNNSTDQNEENLQTVSLGNGGLLAGLYVNGQVGYADTHMNNKIKDIGASLSNNGLAGRVAIGYKFNPNYALEVGYLQLPEGRFDFANKSSFNKQNALDIAGKASLPVTHNVNLYGKLGMAYLTTKLDQTPYDNNSLGIAKHQWAPEAAIGMGYDVTSNISVDTSFTHIHPLGTERAGAINFLAVGLGYTFG